MTERTRKAAVSLCETTTRSPLLLRLMKQNGNAVSDAELLEILLSPATSEAHRVAIRLLETFGTLHSVLHAGERELSAVDGVGHAVLETLLMARLFGQRVLQSEIASKPLLPSWKALEDYFLLTMAGKQVEEFRILFLDARYRLIADELIHRGTINHTAVYPREVVKRALELYADGIILLHNHPCGDPAPSGADIELTRKIIAATKTVGIAVHEHVIVGEGSYYSFKSYGLLQEEHPPAAARKHKRKK